MFTDTHVCTHTTHYTRKHHTTHKQHTHYIHIHTHTHTHRGERWHEVRSVSRCRAMDPPPQPNPILRPPPCSPLASVCVRVCVRARERVCVCVWCVHACDVLYVCVRARVRGPIAFAYVNMDMCMCVGICAVFRLGFSSAIGFSSGCRRQQAA